MISKANWENLWGQACKVAISGETGNGFVGNPLGVGGTLRGHCLVFHYKEARKPGERGASLAEVEEDTEEVNKGLRGLLGLLGYLGCEPNEPENRHF